ncbi:MAG TPA: formate--tetrahydrofolate ligase [Anaerohalosphaeraceae bacterium]|nr:formate--tetrahydrofolate ligase [Anaerohalosphaeraceae bacterium]HOM76022.1 formate--tetrahydrofolate ligase [Anaerohalosphaeraceae bacterium]HPO70131.1 formate--tetrahydrofolate ligase [Anaerohalosphaeraceae bacterium]HRV20930.1 formate--tetrahydrofolate ligase [Anaerohalosphaeraceae bacterium]
MTKLDPTKMKDWQIAEAAEENMKPLYQLARDLGLAYGELLPVGEKLAKLDYAKILDRLRYAPTGRYIDVTAITPTPLGEGKTTTTIGLVQGLGKLGKRVCGCIRQPSGGPTFNIKGSAAGGGLSQCIPMVPFSIRLTGDIECVTNAHNLAMVALTARMQHEHNYDDERLAKIGLRRLNIDPDNVQIKWAIDFCAQALRNITIGKGGKMDGLEMESGAQISVSSEVMAILAVSKNLRDLRERMSKIVVAYDKNGNEVTTADLEVDGAMTAWMLDAINPNLVQTIEGQPILVHAGPFANIAIGQSSIIADLVATKLCDYVVTESGFGADIGFEKFWNLKCRMSGLKPHAVVIVATIRALKMHGGGPVVKPGKPLGEEYTKENLELLEKGCDNLIAHIEIVRKSGIRPIVCINKFYTDTDAELRLVRRIAEQHHAEAAVSDHWLKGGEGALELSEKVAAIAQEEKDFRYLYDLEMPHQQRIEKIAVEIYGAKGVTYTDKALAKIRKIDSEPRMRQLGTCMVKTHLSLSHDPDLKGRPTGWELPIRDVMVYEGAGYVVPIAGDIKLMPGTGSDPAFRRIDVDVKTGKVTGIF